MKIKPTQRHGKPVWELDSGVVDGQRRRLFFRTEKAARLKLFERKSDFESAGRRWNHLTATAKAKVLHILDEMEAKGVTLEPAS